MSQQTEEVLIPETKAKQKVVVEEADGKWRGNSKSYTEGQQWDKAKEMNFTYTNLDKFVRYSLGENAHFSNAFYDGDYSLTLDQAQEKKYRLQSHRSKSF
ncbi:hypothetical protein LBMAG27_25500 [Bacteroidota bacterium]|nr:hypothetical protein LBMAG27_25500 [Bacteroidota bacterium]